MINVEPDGVAGWVVGLMDALGAPGVGLAIALENVFPPLPSEVFLPLAGFAAARGELGVVSAIAWTTLGSLVGALVLYGIGAALGRERMWALADRMPLVDLRDVRRAEAWFARHGAKAVFLGRMVPLVRSLISVPAGVERMPLPLFAALTTAGSLVWNTGFVLAGYLLGANWALVEPYADVASKAVLGLLALAVAVFVVRRVAARRRAGADRPGADGGPIGSAGVRTDADPGAATARLDRRPGARGDHGPAPVDPSAAGRPGPPPAPHPGPYPGPHAGRLPAAHPDRRPAGPAPVPPPRHPAPRWP